MDQSLSMLWRRIDVPGHDAARLELRDGSWLLQGTAVFRHEAASAHLAYEVTCDLAWRTRLARVSGWVGARSVLANIERTPAGTWCLNGSRVEGLDGCVDVDFGFTPATNVTQLRRIQLAVGQAVDVPVAWMDVDCANLVLLPQRYERRGERAYWYRAPTVPYSGQLDLAPNGFVRRYPGLWVADGIE